MNLKVIASIALFSITNLLIIILIIFLQPELILKTKFEQITLVTPLTTISDNQRLLIISFKNNEHGKEFTSACNSAIGLIDNQYTSICEYKYKIQSIKKVLGCTPTTLLSKNRKFNTIFIKQIDFIDKNGKNKNFTANVICAYDESKREFFYFLILVVNLAVISYVFQLNLSKQGRIKS